MALKEKLSVMLEDLEHMNPTYKNIRVLLVFETSSNWIEFSKESCAEVRDDYLTWKDTVGDQVMTPLSCVRQIKYKLNR